MSLLNKILFTPQTLTDDQKRIARENIGAAAATTKTYFDENTISGDGSQAHPYTVKPMEAATAQANGKGGIVPTPVGGDDQFDKRVLCSNGQWRTLRQLSLLTDSDLVNILAKPYDSTSTYNVGDLVYHERKLWKCTVAIDVPKAWSGDTNWTDITIDVFNNTNPGLVPICTEQGIRILKSDGTWVEVEEYTTAYIDGLDWTLIPNAIVIDGVTYNTVTIGNQIWMAENLAYQTSNSSASADPSYGLLYPWSDLENIPIPNGWRIPSANDVYQLVGTNGLPSTDYRSSSWSNGSNTTGFSAVPAGYIDNGRLYTNENLIFTTTRGDLQYAFQISDSSGYNKAREVHGGTMKNYKMSVRLVKDVT